jgi:hypothetical protein
MQLNHLKENAELQNEANIMEENREQRMPENNHLKISTFFIPEIPEKKVKKRQKISPTFQTQTIEALQYMPSPPVLTVTNTQQANDYERQGMIIKNKPREASENFFIKIKEEPRETSEETHVHPILNLDKKELGEVIEILLNGHNDNQNCTALAEGILDYLQTGKKPNTAASTKFSLDHFSVNYTVSNVPLIPIKKEPSASASEINKRNPKSTAMITDSVIVRQGFGEKAPYDVRYPNTDDGNIDLTQQPIIHLDNDFTQKKASITDLDRNLQYLASNHPSKVSFGIICLGRSGTFVNEMGHMLVYHATPSQVTYIDAQQYHGKNKTKAINQDLKALFTFAGVNDYSYRSSGPYRSKADTFGNIIFYTPLGPGKEKLDYSQYQNQYQQSQQFISNHPSLNDHPGSQFNSYYSKEMDNSQFNINFQHQPEPAIHYSIDEDYSMIRTIEPLPIYNANTYTNQNNDLERDDYMIPPDSEEEDDDDDTAPESIYNNALPTITGNLYNNNIYARTNNAGFSNPQITTYDYPQIETRENRLPKTQQINKFRFFNNDENLQKEKNQFNVINPNKYKNF